VHRPPPPNRTAPSAGSDRSADIAVTSLNDRCIVGLVGAGIGPSLSPAMHEREADRLGIRYVYQLLDLDALGLVAESVGDLLLEARHMGFRGLNITHPCKRLVVESLDALSPEAAMLGAVNTIVFDGAKSTGYNTDFSGFCQSFSRGLEHVARDEVVVIGAGGAGAAVSQAALMLGVGKLTVFDTQPIQAAELVEQLNLHFGDTRAAASTLDALDVHLATADGVVNATPIGMAAYPGTPFAPELLRRDLWVADIVYRPLETELLRLAAEAGCRTLNGGGMAVFQAAESFRLFTGLTPDSDRMLSHFAELVAGTAQEASAEASVAFAS
jgi:quinate/shikimate dehydrogenase (NAD+)